MNEIQGLAAVAIVEKSLLDRNWVLEALKRNYDRAMQLEEIKDESGKVLRMEWNGNVANKAVEIVARVIGAFNEESEKREPKAVLPQWLVDDSKDADGFTGHSPAQKNSTDSESDIKVSRVQ